MSEKGGMQPEYTDSRIGVACISDFRWQVCYVTGNAESETKNQKLRIGRK